MSIECGFEQDRVGSKRSEGGAPVPSLTRVDHDSEAGRWTLWRRAPAAPLRPFVRELQGYEECGARPVVRKELPMAGIPLIIVLGHHFALHENASGEGVRGLHGPFVAGLHTRPAIVSSPGVAFCMQVDFTPPGARRFLRTDLCELAGRVVDLGAISPQLSDALVGRLREARSWPDRFALLEEWLATRILSGDAADPRVEASWRTIDATAGRVRIEDLAGSLAMSRKHLSTIFKKAVGQSPKTAARLARFSHAVNLMERHPGGAKFADIALRCGYADQAHFCREFQGFAGEPPAALLKRMLPDGTGLMAR